MTPTGRVERNSAYTGALECERVIPLPEFVTVGDGATWRAGMFRGSVKLVNEHYRGPHAEFVSVSIADRS